MSPEQFDRWRDFALRMARTAFKGYRRPGPRLDGREWKEMPKFTT